MTFSPVVAGSGIVAWKLMTRTLDTQSTAFAKSPEVLRDTEYFESTIGSINTAEELVADRRLLRVALGAFGLQDDINNRAFIQKILEGGSIKDDALANKLTDDRYRELSKSFGFGDFNTPRTKLSYFGAEITEKFRRQQFEVAVGEQDDTMRLALNADRVLADMADSSASDDTLWFRIMGNPPLRQVMETALGLPSSFSQLDIDQQLDIFKDRAERNFGGRAVAQFADPEVREKVVQRFLLRAQLDEYQTASAGAVAVSLLQSASAFARSLRSF